MKEYLVGLCYHEPEGWQLFQDGIDDYESSTAVFITAATEEKALEWGEYIAEALFKWVNPEENNTWQSFGYACWIEKDVNSSGWRPSIGFFLHVSYGEMPNLELMDTKAFVRWQQQNK